MQLRSQPWSLDFKATDPFTRAASMLTQCKQGVGAGWVRAGRDREAKSFSKRQMQNWERLPTPPPTPSLGEVAAARAHGNDRWLSAPLWGQSGRVAWGKVRLVWEPGSAQHGVRKREREREHNLNVLASPRRPFCAMAAVYVYARLVPVSVPFRSARSVPKVHNSACLKLNEMESHSFLYKRNSLTPDPNIGHLQAQTKCLIL